MKRFSSIINSLAFRKAIRLIIFYMLTFMMIVNLSGGVDAASDPWTGTYQEGSEEKTWDMTGFRDKALKIYGIFDNIALAVATVAFSAGAFMMLLGDERQAAAGKKQMKIVLITIFALQLVPLVLSAGYDLVSEMQWDPYNPTGS